MPFEKLQIEKELQNKYELEISDKFWSLVQQRLGLPEVPNPKYIKINFNSSHPKVREKLRLENEEFDIDRDVVVQGVFDYESEEMHFNISPDEVEKEVLAEIIVHELIHCAQIQGNKYAKMKPPFKNDKNLPWEKEAYGLMKPLAIQLMKDFNLEEI